MTQKFKKDEFESDTRNVSEVWNRALQAYNETTGTVLVAGRFADTQAMIDFGTSEMKQFHKWRHDDRKVDKLRKLFIGNIDYIETGISQVVSAASTAFPPAAAIGTAITFVLSACKSVSADYDVVINFFEDMNNFLQRVTIIAHRVPRKRAYQNALVDVFSSFLSMCAVAHKFIKLGRFKKWAINAVFGGDSDLADGRKTMDTSLSRLQSATEFAILDNSENMLDRQSELGDSLADFQRQLVQNQKVQDRLASSQSLAIQSLSDDLQEFRDEIKELLKLQAKPQQQPQDTQNEASDDSPTTNHRVKAIFGSMPNALAPLRRQEASRVIGTGAWLFEDKSWAEWANWNAEAPSLLCIEGSAGVGKSHLLACVCKHLKDISRQDSQNLTCLVYFPFSDETFFRNFIAFIIHGAVQMADQSVPYREHLDAKLTNEESMLALADGTAEGYWDFFYQSVFTEDSKFRLYLVFDGLDNVDDEDLQQEIPKLVTLIRQNKSPMKVVCTGRLSQPEVSTTKVTIQLDKQRILPDLRILVWDRLHQNDSAYEGLKKLQMYTKRKLARKIEQHADGLMYVEQMLRYLSGVHRETVVNKILDDKMPNNVSELYETMLDNSKTHVSESALVVMRTIITWIAFSFRPLTLGELGLVVQQSSVPGMAQDYEEALNRLSPFIEIRNTSTTSNERDSNIDLGMLFESKEAIVDAPANIEDNFQVSWKDRSMATFFASKGNVGRDLRVIESQAQYQIFITCAQLILKDNPNIPLDTTATGLRDYALQSLFSHWEFIKPGEINEQERSMVLATFAQVILDRKFASSLERLPLDLTVSDIAIGDDLQSDWKSWANIAKDAALDQNHHNYWSGDPGDALWPLAKWHLRNWLDSVDAKSASRAYRFARDITKLTKYAHYLDRSFEYENPESETEDAEPELSATEDGAADAMIEIENLKKASGAEIGSNAHFAISVILAERESFPAALLELNQALDSCASLSERARDYAQYLTIYARLNDYEAMIKYANLALGTGADSSAPSVGDVLKATYVAEQAERRTDTSKGNAALSAIQGEKSDKPIDRFITGSMYCQVLQAKATAEDALGMHGVAAATLAEARACNPELVPAEVLLNELGYLWNDGQRSDAIMDTLMNFKPLERLHLLTSSKTIDEHLMSPAVLAGPSQLLILASTKSRRQPDLIKVYEEVIAKLDANQVGAPLRVRLAVMLEKMKNNSELAKKLLNQVLDGIAEDLMYEVTNVSVMNVAYGAISALAYLILEEFGQSKNPGDKLLLFSEAKSLPQRSLITTAGLWTSTMEFNWRFCMAKMARKVGSIVEFQSVMQKMFDTAVEHLSDKTTLNDSGNIFCLAKVLAIMPKCQELALLVLSTCYYSLEAEEAEVEEGQDTASTKVAELVGASEEVYPLDPTAQNMTCDGMCYPSTVFQPGWHPENPWYWCLVCPAGLCQKCYETRLKWNADISSKPETEPFFCCTSNQYLHGPAKGFRGVKNGVLYLDEDQNELRNGDKGGGGTGIRQIPFKQLLEDVKVAWKEALDDYNAGY